MLYLSGRMLHLLSDASNIKRKFLIENQRNN